MAARDRYESKILCPGCSQAGALSISEDDHPYMKNPHREVDSIDGEFSASVTDGIKIKIKCNLCGISFDKF